MFLFLLTSGLFLFSSFPSHFISCSTRGLPGLWSCLASFWLGPCRCLVGKKQVVEDSFQSSLSSMDPSKALWCDAKSVCWELFEGHAHLSSQRGCHHKASPPLTQSFLFVLCFPLEKRRRIVTPESRKVYSSLSLSCSSDMRAGWLNFGYGLKLGSVIERGSLQSEIKGRGFSKFDVQLMAVFLCVLCITFIPAVGKQSFLSRTVRDSSLRQVGVLAHVDTGTSQNLQLVLSVRNPWSLLAGSKVILHTLCCVFMPQIQYILLKLKKCFPNSSLC